MPDLLEKPFLAFFQLLEGRVFFSGEYACAVFQKMRFPGGDLIRVYLELRGNFGDLPLALDGLKNDCELLLVGENSSAFTQFLLPALLNNQTKPVVQFSGSIILYLKFQYICFHRRNEIVYRRDDRIGTGSAV